MGFGKLLSWEAACREMKGLVWGSYWVILAPVTLHPQVWVFLATLDLSGHGLRRSPQHAGGPWLPSLAHVPVPVAFADHPVRCGAGQPLVSSAFLSRSLQPQAPKPPPGICAYRTAFVCCTYTHARTTLHVTQPYPWPSTHRPFPLQAMNCVTHTGSGREGRRRASVEGFLLEEGLGSDSLAQLAVTISAISVKRK